MLKTLRVRELAIIDDLEVRFAPGLNLLTGETGAGKSILIDAVGLVIGDRADRGLVRAGADKAIVEALFELPENSAIPEWARDKGVEPAEHGEWLIRREVSAEGSNRIFVNGSPCTLALLRELGEQLVEVHGQHDHQTLLRPEHQLALLDSFGGNLERVEQVRAARDEVLERRARIDALRMAAESQGDLRERLERTISDIDQVNPLPGELKRLECDRRMLQHSARMAELLEGVVTACYTGEPTAASLSSRAARQAAELAEIDPELADLATRLDTASVELQDLGAAFRDYRDRCDFDPHRLEQLEQRRVALERLCLQYGRDEDEILARREEALRELAALQGSDDMLKDAVDATAIAEQAYRSQAEKLGRARKKAAKQMAPAVEAQLVPLALEGARLTFSFSAARGDMIGQDGDKPLPLNSRGAEKAELLLSANPGEPARPLSKVASGGELSRVMLALHGVLDGEGDGRTLLFDEIDAGVGGGVGAAVGSRLARLAQQHQVLCVTHLPQVAAHADSHYIVCKDIKGERTVTTVQPLAQQARVDELARMLGGKRTTELSRRHASELLTTAAARPRSRSRRTV